METIQILDEKALAEISLQATKYAYTVIAVNVNENFNTIYELKRQLLVLEQSTIQERQRMMEREKKREQRMEELKEQVEQLKRQIR